MPIGVCRNFYAVIEGNRALLCINRTGGIAVRHDFQLSLALEGQLALAVNPVAMIGKGVQAVIAALDTHRAFIGQINRRALLQLPLRNSEGKVFNGQRLLASQAQPASVSAASSVMLRKSRGFSKSAAKTAVGHVPIRTAAETTPQRYFFVIEIPPFLLNFF